MKRVLFILSSAFFIFTGLLSVNAKPVHELFVSDYSTNSTIAVISEFSQAPILPCSAIKETKEITTVFQVRYITGKQKSFSGDYFGFFGLSDSYVCLSVKNILQAPVSVKGSRPGLFVFHRQLLI
ncbi:MAG: hypothetical protein ACOZCO_02715 [Bacteroidota bacterium]